MSSNDTLINKINLLMPSDKSIVFVGMMGAGKSTVGRRLAFQLNMDFVDTDLEIENAAQLSISEIFATYGETHFREIEHKIITRLLYEKRGVISIGGGAFMDKSLRDYIAQKGISVWLYADFETLMKRVHNQMHRPLLQQNDPEIVMKNLINVRYPIYRQSDISIENNDLSLDNTIHEILTSLHTYLSKTE